MYEMAKIRMYFRNQRLNLCYFFQLYDQNENGGAKLNFMFHNQKPPTIFDRKSSFPERMIIA
jgi:hypothetical protein